MAIEMYYLSVHYTEVCFDCSALEETFNLMLTGNMFEKAYDIPSHLRSAAFYVAVCLKVLQNHLCVSALP